MNFAELRERTKNLCWVGGWSEVQPPPNWALLVRQGHRSFFWEAQILTSTQTLQTVAEQMEYTLTIPPEWIVVTDVLYGTQNAPIVQITEAKLRRIEPSWLTARPSTPLYWWMSRPNTIRLWPAPSVGGVTVRVHGVRADNDLVNDLDVPSCPEIYHEGIALFAAWHHGKLYSRGEDRVILENYLAEARAIVDRCREYFAAQDTAAFARKVKKLPQEYVAL